MDKSTKFQMRINEELLAAMDAQATIDGTTRTQFIILAIKQRLDNALTPEKMTGHYHSPLGRTVSPVAPSIHTANSYSRPEHDPTCRCGVCKLSKPDK